MKDENEKDDNIEEQLKYAGDTEKPGRLERCQKESTMKTIFKIYETSRLKCRNFMDIDNEVFKKKILLVELLQAKYFILFSHSLIPLM